VLHTRVWYVVSPWWVYDEVWPRVGFSHNFVYTLCKRKGQGFLSSNMLLSTLEFSLLWTQC
jgi:hypothetical protein